MITNQSEQMNDELNFTAFIDLCRFCSIKSGPRVHIFDKEAEQRQLLFKIRTVLPIIVSTFIVHVQMYKPLIGLKSLVLDIKRRLFTKENL